MKVVLPPDQEGGDFSRIRIRDEGEVWWAERADERAALPVPIIIMP